MEQPVQPAPPGPVPDRETDLHYNTFRHCDPAVGLNTDTYLGGSLVRGEPLELMCDKTAPVDRVETDVVASQRIFY